MQSDRMDSKWAAEQLQVIRTLMERSAIYRRALAPIMLCSGLVGLVTMIAGFYFHLESTSLFCGLWLGSAVVAITGAFLIARRQAFKDNEPFWSAPTRRVALALAPPLCAGMFLGVLFLGIHENATQFVTMVWILFYGCALHSAGFFMPRGVKRFGWIFMGSGCAYAADLMLNGPLSLNSNGLMGIFFGGLHLAYGAYLYLTEKGKNAA